MKRADAHFARARIARKLGASPLAAAALAVVVAYALVAVVLACGGLFSLEESLVRVGPDSTPGWFGEQSVEKRLGDARFHLARVEQALAQEDVAPALGDLALAELAIAPKTPEELRAVAARAEVLLGEITARLDAARRASAEANRLELWTAGARGPHDRARRAEPATGDALEALTELESTVDELFAPLAGADRFWYGLRRSLGTDGLGRSIAVRAIRSIVPALSIGAVTALVCALFGTLLGAAAAFYGGLVDYVVVWLYSTLSSIPSLVMLIVLAYAFLNGPWEQSLLPVYAALCTTFWIGPCRVARGEVAKLKELEYVQAATAVGFGRAYVLVRHVVPNLAHLMLVHFSLLFVAAVKAEVILSYLGLGVRHGPSFGTMIRAAQQEVLRASFWQIGAATAFLLLLVLSFSVLCDALQDAFDPKVSA